MFRQPVKDDARKMSTVWPTIRFPNAIHCGRLMAYNAMLKRREDDCPAPPKYWMQTAIAQRVDCHGHNDESVKSDEDCLVGHETHRQPRERVG
jgi:hypothetical protein